MRHLFLFLGLLVLAPEVRGQSPAVTINADWHVQLDPEDALTPTSPTEDWDRVNLPHTFNLGQTMDEERGYYRGPAWYAKRLYIPSTEQNELFLLFEGAGSVAEVYVNGTKAGHHVGGYSAFVVDIRRHAKLDDYNDIRVRVTNARNPSVPPLSGDFTMWGGLHNDVLLIRKGAARFDLTDGSTKGVYFGTELHEAGAALHVRAEVTNTAKKGTYSLEYRLLDGAMNEVATGRQRATLQPGSHTLAAKLPVDQVDLWSPSSPTLYYAEVSLVHKGQVVDRLTDRVGFRSIAINDQGKFVLNGEVITLYGTNRHQYHQPFGNAVPFGSHYKDVRALKEMGGNFIRTSHYTQDRDFLAACDEVGLLVFEESSNVNSLTISEAYFDNAKQIHRETVRQHYNHPSVVMWGFLNEILLRDKAGVRDNPHLTKEEYYQEVNRFARELNQLTKDEDSTRFTCIVNHMAYERYEEAGLNTVCDIIGMNLYQGWYVEGLENFGAHMDMFRRDHPGKPFLITEFGGGADPRIHSTDPHVFDFSEQYQMLIHASYFKQITQRPYCMGGNVWTLIDFGSEGRGDAVPRINSKGLLALDHSPKDAYVLYQALLRKEPFVAIGSHHWRHRAGVSPTDQLEQKVWVFSNQDQVELSLNGKSLGSYSPTDGYVEVAVPFRPGKNELEASAGDQRDVAYFQVEVIAEQLTSLLPRQVDFHMNVGSPVYFVDDILSQVWIPERPYTPGSFGYVGGSRHENKGRITRIGTRYDIQDTYKEPVYQTFRDSIEAFRADLPPGLYRVTLHVAENFSAKAREAMANDLSAEGEDAQVDIDRHFTARVNGQPVVFRDLADFQATPVTLHVRIAPGEQLDIQFSAEVGSALLCGIEVKGH